MSHIPGLIPRMFLDLLTTLTTTAVTSQCHIQNYVTSPSSEESKPKVGTGHNGLQSEVTRGTKASLGTGHKSDRP